ncbi:MAG: hypothetical protein RMJ31_07255 [Nitrososphaerota archaeon]|nr:hypothetical protein [Nitrososphaerota archaeon]
MSDEENGLEIIKLRLELFKALKELLSKDLKKLKEMQSIEAQELVNEIIEVFRCYRCYNTTMR